MTTQDELLQTASRRQQEQQLPYFGALTPEEAWTLLQLDGNAVLVDVRTRAELDWVGGPTLPEGQSAHIEWNSYPGSVQNPAFADQLKASVPSGVPVLFLCRSAVRSKHAARVAAEAGYPVAIDVLEGFEGNRDEHQHRKTLEGWCFRGLPWRGA